MKSTDTQEPIVSDAIQTAAAASGARKPSEKELADKPPETIQDFRAKGPNLIMTAIGAVASLKLTVTLFVLSIFLVFFGTLAQVDNGIWTVVAKYFRSFFVWVPFQIFPKAIGSTTVIPGGFPFPGGWLLGSLLLTNLLAAHVLLTAKLFSIRTSGRQFLLTMLKRSGILILHTGLVVMMVGEFITGQYAVEGQMTIEGGQSSNYLEHQQHFQVSFTNSFDQKTDDVVVVPDRFLKNGGLIQHPDLPVDIIVKKYMVNSVLTQQAPADQKNLATAGLGLKTAVAEKPEVSGTDTDQKVDIAAAYVAFKDKQTGADLGTYLVTPWLKSQQVAVNGKVYDVDMRFKRTYKPYTVHLQKFTHEIYQGTDIPKNFASEVRLVDPTENEDFEAHIWMNHPLRYNGETFYQQGFLPDDSGTIIQVVRNPGWLLPYISCIIVAAGMIVHFGIKLVQFLTQTVSRTAASAPSSSLARYLPITVLPLGLLLLLVFAGSPRVRQDEMNLHAFASLPVLEGGRVKPIDTFARNNLMILNNRQTYKDKDGRTQPAVRWILDVFTERFAENPASFDDLVFRIDNDQMRSFLGLPWRDDYRYSINDLSNNKLKQFFEKAQTLRGLDPNKLNEFDGNIHQLDEHLQRYMKLRDFADLKLIPPMTAGSDWRSLRDSIRDEQAKEQRNPATTAFIQMLVAYHKQDVAGFNRELATFQKYVDEQAPADAGTVDFEVSFNNLAPFYISTVLYGFIAVIACIAFLLYCMAERTWAEPLRRGAFWLAVLTVGLHIWGLIARMYIQDRMFVMVTNLYSSAVFIGGAGVLLGLFLEVIFRNGIGVLVAGVLGFLTALIAHNLAAAGDTLEMMRAVLDTNFWLATHVTCVTLGYSATFFAGLLAVVFVLLGVTTPWMSRDLMRSLGLMIYGVVAFATLLSFVGTVLGGIWADQSWGRFWGWDAKENGALIIVLWNALILHARWAGLVKQRGMAVLAIGGNIVTSWSWFGVNMLGVGLHSYGFMKGAGYWLMAFDFSQFALIGLGLIPLRHWRSAAELGENGR
jgi:ABC-type transport system involved in cytochrome c biogenesis permease subunit